MKHLVQVDYGEPKKPRDLAAETLIIHQRSEATSARGLVIFVHGLGGTRYKKGATWGDYPKLVFANFPSVDVGMYSYRTLFRRLVFWKSVPLEKEAGVFADLLQSLKQYRVFVLLGHSMGGVLCKGAIANLVQKNQSDVARKVRGMILMATPQFGSLRVPRGLAWVTKDFQALAPHNAYVGTIADVFQNQIHSDLDYPLDERLYIPIWILRAAEDFWVDPLSAGVGIRAEQTRTVHGTHTSIVKPAGKNDDGFQFVSEGLKLALSDSAEPVRNDEYFAARFEELTTIHELAVKVFGTSVSDLHLMQEWWRVNKRIFWVIRRVVVGPGKRSEKFVGYFCVIPLKAAAVDLIRRGQVTGANLGTEHIARPTETPAALYVGAVVGTDFTSRGSSLHYLMAYVRSFDETQGVTVLTRPVTDQGLQTAIGKSMVPVAGSGGIGQMYEGKSVEFTQ